MGKTHTERAETHPPDVNLVVTSAMPAKPKFRIALGAICIALPWLAASLQVPAPMRTAPRDEDVIKNGLVAWRTAGGKFNSACSSCHAPDAFDLAQFNFDDATIRRRALAHVDSEHATKIVALVHATRRKYHLTPIDPMTARPFQPGGFVLPGKIAADRDLAFGKSLEPLLPTLMNGRIDSLAKAQMARDEILALDPRNLQVGFEMNRWSEDIYHGDEHGTIADWMADVPCAPDPAKQQEWFALVDKYIADPSDANFWPMYNAVPDDTKPYTNMAFSNEFSLRKYESMLIAQHLMRKATATPASPVMFADQGTGDVPNPFWQVGEYAVFNEGLDGDSQGMPDLVIKDLSKSSSFLNQLRAMKVPWLWTGWLFDQGLQRTPGDQNTRNARYFTLSLYTDGNYALHDCFMITRKQLVQSFVPAALPEGKQAHFILDYSEFAAHRNAIRYEPQEPERQAMFRKMADNAFRMSLYLLIDDAKRTGVVASRAIDEFQLQAIREYLIYSDPEHKAENVALADRCLDVVEASKDSNARGDGR